MKTQKMKSSKFTQVNSPNDNEFRDYQNVMTVLPDDGNQNVERNPYVDTHCHVVTNSSELLLKGTYEPYMPPEPLQEMHPSPERNANRFKAAQEIEMMCNCVGKEIVFQPKTRFVEQCNSDSVVMNRSFASLPKLATTNLSQFSLDRKMGKYHQRQKHAYTCEQSQKMMMDKTASLRKMQSPEIINIHRGPPNVFYPGYGPENCVMKACGDEYGFRRGHSIRATGSR